MIWFFRILAALALLFGGLGLVVGVFEVCTGVSLHPDRRLADLPPDLVKRLGAQHLFGALVFLLFGWLNTIAARRRHRGSAVRAEGPLPQELHCEATREQDSHDDAVEQVSDVPAPIIEDPTGGVVRVESPGPEVARPHALPRDQVDHFPGGIVIATVAVIVLVMGIGIVTSPRTAEHASPPNYREASRAVHVEPPSTHARRLVPRVARLNPVEEIPETIGVPGVRSSRGGIESRDGSFRGDAYVNEFFGLSIELPKDWTLPDRTARRTVARATAARIFRDPAMRQTVIESVDSSDEQLSLFMCASGEQSGASITLKAFRVDELEPDFRVQDVLETFSANAAAIFVDAPRVGPTQPVDLGGVRWWRVRFVVDSDGVILRNALFARIERGWILMLATCDRTVGERAEIQAALDSVRCW